MQKCGNRVCPTARASWKRRTCMAAPESAGITMGPMLVVARPLARSCGEASAAMPLALWLLATPATPAASRCIASMSTGIASLSVLPLALASVPPACRADSPAGGSGDLSPGERSGKRGDGPLATTPAGSGVGASICPCACHTKHVSASFESVCHEWSTTCSLMTTMRWPVEQKS